MKEVRRLTPLILIYTKSLSILKPQLCQQPPLRWMPRQLPLGCKRQRAPIPEQGLRGPASLQTAAKTPTQGPLKTPKFPAPSRKPSSTQGQGLPITASANQHSYPIVKPIRFQKGDTLRSASQCPRVSSPVATSSAAGGCQGKGDRRSSISRANHPFLLLILCRPHRLLYCTCSAALRIFLNHLLATPTHACIQLIHSQPSYPRYPIAQTEGVSAIGHLSLSRPLASAPAWPSAATGWGALELNFSANQQRC